MDRNAGQWFVLQTLSGHENKVRENIESQLKKEEVALPVYEVLISSEKVSEVRNGKKLTINRKVFPSYVFVRMDLYKEDGSLNEAVWYFVREIQGVIGFPCGNDHPQPISPDEVANLLRQVSESGDKEVLKVPFVIGEIVRIKSGPFENFEGVIKKIDKERGRLELEVSIFGRSTPTELEFWQVEREQ